MEPNRNDSSNNKNNNPDGKKPRGRLFTMLLIALAVSMAVGAIYNAISDSKYTETKYSDFLAEEEAGNLAEVEIHGDRIYYLTKTEADKEPDERQACYAGLPAGNHMALLERLHAAGVESSEKIVEDNSFLTMILSYALMIGVLMLGMSLISRRMGPAGGMGDNKAKVYMEKQTGVTFKDVAGQDEAKESLQEIIDFLHNPQKYAEIGAKLPKGALLVGSPGTG